MTDPQAILAGYEQRLEQARNHYWQRHRAMEEAKGAVEVAKAAFSAAQEMFAAAEQADNSKRPSHKRQRSLTGNWQRLMTHVHASGNTFGYDQLELAARALGLEVSKETMRSQMSNYKSAGLIDAAGPGEFRLTEAGLRAAKVADTNSQNDSEVSESNEFSSQSTTVAQGGFADDIDDDIPF